MLPRTSVLTALLLAAGTAHAQLPPMPGSGDPSATPQPKLHVTERIRDLGTVLEGDVVPVTWLLENRGEADLDIESVKASCGCTVISVADDDRTIPPGSMLELTAEFDSVNRRGENRKHVTVETNDPAEPFMRLEFTAEVAGLYDVRPPGALSLRMLQRGQVGDRSLELVPVPGRSLLEITDVRMENDVRLEYEVDEIESSGASGRRLSFRAGEGAPLGIIDNRVDIDVNVDGLERTLSVRVTGEVVADIFWQPKLVDGTRSIAYPGRKLTPVILSATEATPFEIVDVEAGPHLDVSYSTLAAGTRYRIDSVIREDAPSGPFAETITVRTNSLDQPVLDIPAFGNVAPLVEIDPPIVVLRRDGTPAGVQRRVRIQTHPQKSLELLGGKCTNDAVKVSVDHKGSARYKHLRFLDVRLDASLPAGTYDAKINIATSLKGAETIEIPVRIEIPSAE